MKLINTRSLVAALGLSLLAQGAWAQSATSVTPATAAPTSAVNVPPAAIAPSAPVTTSNGTTASSSTPAATASSRQDKHGDMAQKKHQQALVQKLALSPAQKIQYDAAQDARQDLRKQKQANAVARKKAIADQANKDQMDPRAVIEASKQSRAALEAKRAIAEQKWLAFWDGLTTEQRKTFTADMKARQEQHAQKHQGSPRG